MRFANLNQLFSALETSNWNAITTPGNERYSVLWKFIIPFEFTFTAGLIAANIALIILFFKKSVKFPKFFTIYMIAGLTFVLLDFGFMLAMSNEVGIKIGGKNAFQAIVGAVIWISYIRKSKRVANTFVVN